MKYYAYRNVVIKCLEDVNWKEIVLAMRAVYNRNTFHPVMIMIEDINEVDEEDYKQYIVSNGC